MRTMRHRTFALALLLAALLGPLPAAAQRSAPTPRDALNVRTGSASLVQILKLAFGDGEIHLPASLPGEDLEKVRLQVTARGVEPDLFLRAVLEAAGLEAEKVGGALWVRRAAEGSEDRLTWEELDGFEVLVAGDRDFLAEALEEAGPRLDPATRTYLRYRRELKSQKVRPDEVRGGKSFLGIRLATPGRRPRDLPTEVDKVLSKWDGWGCFVLEVVPESPAARSGILAGDVIIKFAGLWVDSPNTLIRLVSRAEADREYEIEVLRGRKVRREWAVVVERPEPERAPQRPGTRSPDRTPRRK